MPNCLFLTACAIKPSKFRYINDLLNQKTRLLNKTKTLLPLFAALCCLLAPSALTAQNTQRGKATYYSKRATGARTSSGERLHHDSLTCAHRNYPFGTMLKVTNLGNGKTVTVRVTDRGPFTRGRIIDLSYAAAKEIGLIAQGVAMVEVEPVGSMIPLKQTEVLEFPEIDFDVMEAGYSFVDEWKKESEKQQSLRPGSSTDDNGSKGSTLRRPANAAANAHSTARHQRHTGQHGTTTRHAQQQKSANAQAQKNNQKQPEKKAGFWSSVFDKVKHLGDDLF